MTRQDLEKAAVDYFRGIDVPLESEIADFTIKQINLALEEAAKEIEGTPFVRNKGPGLIRALKIGEAK